MRIALVILCLIFTPFLLAQPPPSDYSTEILPAPSQDPWVILHERSYYYIESRSNAIVIRRSNDWKKIGDDPGKVVWTAPASGPYSREVWAPELHHIDARWYIYFAADNGRNENHRMWVLESEGGDPFGWYGKIRQINTRGWAIDGTLFTHEGKRYFVWSGWPGKKDGVQNLYIAHMTDPATLDSPQVLLTEPTEPWERHELPLCEGPASLQRNGRLFIVYSASGSWTQHYCLGLLMHSGGNVLDRSSWTKIGPAFWKTNKVFGPGHCSFVRTPEGKDLIFYHAKSHKENGWGDRSARGKEFGWDEKGMPVFGRP